MTTIANLPDANYPLTGNEVLPVSQSGGTKKISVGDIATMSVDQVVLTGPISASGGVTTLTNQTGTGSVIAVQDAPQFTGSVKIMNTGSGNSFVVEDSASTDSTPFVIDTNGNVLVGSLTQYAISGTTAKHLQSSATGGSAGFTSTLWSSSSSAAPSVGLLKSKGATQGVYSVVASGDLLGSVNFAGDDGSAFISGASISAVVDGTPSANDMPGRLIFATTSDGASSPVERMRIDSTGDLGIGRTPAARLDVLHNHATEPAVRITQTGAGNALVVEDSTSTDASPFVIDANGNVYAGNTVTSGSTLTGLAPKVQVAGLTNNDSSQGIYSFQNASSGPSYLFFKSRDTTLGGHAIVNNGDGVGNLLFQASDRASFSRVAAISALVDGTPALNSTPGRISFATTPSGATTPTTRLQIGATGSINIGSNAPSTTSGVYQDSAITGSVNCSGYSMNSVVQSDVTTTANGFITGLATQAATFTLPNLYHFRAVQGTFGVGSTVSTQHGFYASGSLIGATTNIGFNVINSEAVTAGKTHYAFYSQNNPATGGGTTWNFYASGTAPNYFAGNTTLNSALIQTPTYSTVASGSTITLTTSTNHLLYGQAGTVAALTITLPSASLTNGQTITISTRSEITTLTVNGGTIYGNPTTLAAGGFATFMYSSGGAAWFRKG